LNIYFKFFSKDNSNAFRLSFDDALA